MIYQKSMILIIAVVLGLAVSGTAFVSPSLSSSFSSSVRGPIIGSGRIRLQVVADAPIEKEEEQTNYNQRGENNNDNDNDHDDDEDDWIESPAGGFIPNLKSRFTTVFTSDSSGTTTVKRTTTTPKTKNPIIEVTHIQQYKEVVVDEKEQLVCVRFYAPWCRACKKVESSFRRLPTQFPTVKFVEVPLTKDNAYLHQGLGIPSLPFAHIYEPTVGLCEERTCKKPVFKEFQTILKTYVDQECPVEYEDDENDGTSGMVLNPFAPKQTKTE